MNKSGIARVENHRTLEMYITAGRVEYWTALYDTTAHKLTYFAIFKHERANRRAKSDREID